MKLQITENKLESVFQKMIDKSVLEIKNIVDNTGDDDEIPDWLSYDSANIIDNVDSIKINRIVKDTKMKVYVDVYIDSMMFFDVTELLFDIIFYIKNTFGVELQLIENEVENLRKNKEW